MGNTNYALGSTKAEYERLGEQAKFDPAPDRKGGAGGRYACPDARAGRRLRDW